MYKNKYRYTYDANIKNKISEDEYINVLQELSTQGFKTYHIENFNSLTKKLRSNGLYNSFNISILLYARDLVYKKLSVIATTFEDIGSVFSTKKKKMIHRVNTIQKILENRLDCINCFKKGDMLMYVSPEIEIKQLHQQLQQQINKIDKIGPTKMTPEQIEIEFSHAIRRDIIDRLHLIAQRHYTLEQLTFMNITLVLVSELYNMSHNELRRYYVYVVDEIVYWLHSWINMCKNYIDIEINYAECCDSIMNGDPTHLTVMIDNMCLK